MVGTDGLRLEIPPRSQSVLSVTGHSPAHTKGDIGGHFAEEPKAKELISRPLLYSWMQCVPRPHSCEKQTFARALAAARTSRACHATGKACCTHERGTTRRAALVRACDKPSTTLPLSSPRRADEGRV